jgi:arylsulfatase A-like enzyme
VTKRIQIILFSCLLASFLGAADYLVGLFYNPALLRSDGYCFIFQSLVAGQLLYIGVGLASGILLFAFFSTFSISPGRRLRDFSSVIVFVFSAVFIAALLESFAGPHSNFRLLLDLALFGLLGILAGYALMSLWNLLSGYFQLTPVRLMAVFSAALMVSALVAGMWAVKGPLSPKGKLVLLVFCALFFILPARRGIDCFGKRSILKTPDYFIGIFLVLLGVFLIHPARPDYPVTGKARQPLNIILIIADACRADALSAKDTPNLDRLSREGVLFKNAFSQAPWTPPSMLSVLSGLYPSVLERQNSYFAGKEIELLPERLKGYGYNTYGLLGNYLFSDSLGILQGLDKRLVLRDRYRLNRLFYYPVVNKMHYLCLRFARQEQFPDSVKILGCAFGKFLEKPKPPFFAWVHFYNPHEPYNPPAAYLKEIAYNGFLKAPFKPRDPFHLPEDLAHPQLLDLKTGYIRLDSGDKKFVKELYLAQLRYLDSEVGRMMEELKAKGLQDNTIVIFAADHGEEFWEHGEWEHDCGLFDELTHVPLIIWGAGLKPGMVKDEVGLVDLLPTLADALGIEKNPDWQGKSFYRALTGATDAGQQQAVFSENPHYPEPQFAVRTLSYKLILGRVSGRAMLFDLAADPSEQNDIAKENPEIVKQLTRELGSWQSSNLLLKNRLGKGKLSREELEDLRERLKAVGYVK